MWTCSKCSREFKKTDQPHSCKIVPLEDHFKNKEKAKEIFDHLVKRVEDSVGKVKLISLPCCIHLFGTYDFLAALPKKNSLEVRIGLNRELDSPRVTQSVPTSAKGVKYCFEISSEKEIDDEFVGWLKESYFFHD
jgi:hypothetical protein